MLNFSELTTSLQSPKVAVVLKALGELRERIEIVHTSDFAIFLQKIFPLLRDLLQTRLVPQLTDNSENKCRQIILEIFNRFPNTDVLKPFVFELLKISLRVLIADNEENSLTALRIIFDLHKSFRPSLENQVQPFLEIVQKILKNIPISARSMFSASPKVSLPSSQVFKQPSGPGNMSTSQSAPSLSSMATNGGDTSSGGFDIMSNSLSVHLNLRMNDPASRTAPKLGSVSAPFLKSIDSFKVLTECPLIIMLLFQVYPKFIQKNIPQMLPLMMTILGLQFTSSDLTPQLRVRFREFVAAQVKTLSLITYFLRGFTELMRPYEDTIANNVLVLIRFCPQESVSTRKELLVDFRHILATDFRKGFYKHLDFFIDETFLMGPGQQAYETLRPLAFSTIADLVHHSREYLSFAQLSKVVFLFAKSIHDVQLPVIIQSTSVRILMNISEKFASTNYKDSDTFQRDRKLLSRILRTLVMKFNIINHQIEGVGGCDADHEGDDEVPSTFESLKRNLLTSDRQQPSSSQDGNSNHRHSNSPTHGSVLSEKIFSSSINIASDSMKDFKTLIKNLLLALKVVLSSISAMQKTANATTQPASSVSSTSAGNMSMSMYVLADDEVDHMKLFSKWALKSIACVCKAQPASSKKDHRNNKKTKTTATSPSAEDTSNLATSVGSSALSSYEVDQEIKELLEPMISVYTALQPLCLIRTVLGENLDYVVKLSHSRPIFISLLHQLLMSTSTACSQLTMDTLLTFIVSKLPVLREKTVDVSHSTNFSADDEDDSHINYSSTLLKIFKVSLGVISVHPDNEKVLRPRLCSIIHLCLRLANESTYTLNYILVIRTLFRSISGGKFEHAYKEMNTVLPTLLKGFGYLLHRSKHVETQNAILELSLTIPCRLDTMLSHFPFLLEMFCRAVTAKRSDSLPNLALRTLEFWTDNLKPDYLFSLMSSKPDLLHRIFSGICLHLKPPPYPYGALAARVLGKFGGKNTRFLRDYFAPNSYDIEYPYHMIERTEKHLTTKNVPSMFKIKIPSAFANCDTTIDIEDSVISACSILGGLVSTYAVTEVEVLSVHPPLNDLKSCDTEEALRRERAKLLVNENIDKILLTQRSDVEPSFVHCGINDCWRSTASSPSYATDLYNHISTETAGLVQSIIDCQVADSFNLIKSTLVQVLPVLFADGCAGDSKDSSIVISCRKGSMKAKKSRLVDFTKLENGFHNDSGDFPSILSLDKPLLQSLLTKMFHALICSSVFPQVKKQCDISAFLEGLCNHIALVDFIAFEEKKSADPESYYESHVFSCALNNAIMQSFSDTRAEIFLLGTITLSSWVSAIADVPQTFVKAGDGSKEFTLLSTPLEFFVIDAVDLCSSSDLWSERMTGVRVVRHLCKCLPPRIMRIFDREIMEALLLTVHFADFDQYASVIEDVICTLNEFVSLCYSTPPVDDISISKGVNGESENCTEEDENASLPPKECMEILFVGLECTKILVRIAARSCLLKIIQIFNSATKEKSPLECILPDIQDFFSRTLELSKISSQTVGHVSKMSFLLSHIPSSVVVDHDMVVLMTDLLMGNANRWDDLVSKSSPPFHQYFLNSSAAVVPDPTMTSKISHNLQIKDKHVMEACFEENIDLVISTYPLDVNLGIELRSQMINLFGAIFSSPNVSKEVSVDVKYMPFRERCIGVLHQSLSLKWIQLIDRARSKMITISDDCTFVFKDIYDNMKPFLPLFEDIRNLTLPKLKTLEALIRIVRNKSYLQLSWKLLDQLRHWTNPSRIMQLNLWPAGEEVMIAAAIINIFSILQWDDVSSSNNRYITKTASEVQSEALHLPPAIEKLNRTATTEQQVSIPPLVLHTAASAGSSSSSTTNNISSNPWDGMVKTSVKDAPPIGRSSSFGSTGSRNSSGGGQTQFPIFFNRLIDILMRIERVRCQYQCSQTIESPILIALTRLLEEYPRKCLDFFVESVNLSRPDVIHLLLDIFPLSWRCPTFIDLMLSPKGTLSLIQCIDAYCDSIRKRIDSKGNDGSSSKSSTMRRNDGVLFSSAIQERFAEVKTSRSRPTSLDGSEKYVKGEEEEPQTISATSPKQSSMNVEGDVENPPRSSPLHHQVSVHSQPQQQQQMGRNLTPSPSSTLSHDVLSSPLLLSSYQIQPQSHVPILLDKNSGSLLTASTSVATGRVSGHTQNSSQQLPSCNEPVYPTPFSALTEDSIRRASTNTIKIIMKLCDLQKNFMSEHPVLLKSLRMMLILSINKNNFSVTSGAWDPGPLKSSPKTCSEEELKMTADVIDSKFQEHYEIKSICEILLEYYRRNTDDILILFDLMPVLCTPYTLDFSFLLKFFKMELSIILSFQLKKDVLRAYLSLCNVKTVSTELKVKTLQVMIIPLLLQLFRDHDVAAVKLHVLDMKTIKLIMKNAFFSGDATSCVVTSTPLSTSGLPPVPSSTSEIKALCSDLMKIELLKIATLLIEHCDKELVDNRKDLIKFAWNHLKTEDVITKHWAYVNVCRFISSYDTPPKIILQVYVALLRTYQVEHRDLITMALDILVPALPNRLRYEDFVKAMKWTKKVVFEEGHSLPQLIHVWNLIVRHASLFYPFRSHFIPQMVSSISRLGLPPNCPVEHRHVALGCAEVLVGWELIRTERIKKRLSDSLHDEDGNLDFKEEGGRSGTVEMDVDDKVNEEDNTGDMDISVGDDDDKEREKGGNFSSASSTTASTIVSAGVIKINEKDDEFALHPSMVQMLANFLVRLCVYAADNRDKALSKLADKCVSLYRTLAGIVSMKGIKVVYFERLFQSFCEEYVLSSAGKSLGAGDMAAAGMTLANKATSKSSNSSSHAMMKNRKVDKAPPAKSNPSSGDSKSGATVVSEKAFCFYFKLLHASLESNDPRDTLFFENINLVKQVISPFFQSEHMVKPTLGDLFRKLILKSIRIFSIKKTPEEIKRSDFFHELSMNIDRVITKDYHEVETEAAAAALAANSVNRKKSDGSKGGASSNAAVGKDNYAVCYWTLQLVHDICVLSPAWIENHGSSLVSMTMLFMTLHLNKVTKNCSKVDASSANRSSLSNGKGGLLVNACTNFPTTQMAITAEVQQNPSYLTSSSACKVNPNVATHQNTLTSSLILLVKLLGSALDMGYLRSQKDFTLSILHSILEYSDDYTLWGLAIIWCCKWIARPGSPLTPCEQGVLFNKITNIERWAMDVHAQCFVLRVVALIEVVIKKTDNGTLTGLRKVFSSKYCLPSGMESSNFNMSDCLPLRSLGLMCSCPRLRELCAERIIKNLNPFIAVEKKENVMFKYFITLFDLNYKPFERLYWPSAITSFLLAGVNEVHLCSPMTPHPSQLAPAVGLKEENFVLFEVNCTHPYYSFLKSLRGAQDNSFQEENLKIFHCLKSLSLINPNTGDMIWKQCLEAVWDDSNAAERHLLTNVITRNIACHNYVKSFNWPYRFSNSLYSDLPQNVPHSIVVFMLSLKCGPEFPVAFLGAVGCGYRLWHSMCDFIDKFIDASYGHVQDDDIEHAIRVLLATYLDAGDEDAMLDVYRSLSKCPRTITALNLQSYGFYSDSQRILYRNMKECVGSTLESSLTGAIGSSDTAEPLLLVPEIEMEMWEERWMHAAKKLSQWDVLFDYSMKMNVEDACLESSFMLSNWTKMNRLLIAMPSNNASVSVQVERGGIIPNPEIKMYDAMNNIVDSKPHRSEKVVSSAVESALHKWHSLPPVVGCASSNVSHKWLLHTFHRVVELRESMSMIGEVMKSTLSGKGSLPPDLKGSLLTWRERLPEEWDDMHHWDSLLHWREETFSLIKKSYQSRNIDEAQLACAHDISWTTIMHARAARKNGLSRVSSKILIKFKDIAATELFDAFSKLREQILVYLPTPGCLQVGPSPQKGKDIEAGLSIINSTNLDHYEADQKAELFRLKALFQLELESSSSASVGHVASQQSFAQCLQVCPSYAKGWLSWGELCFDTFKGHCEIAHERHHIANLEYALSTIVCVLKAVENSSEVGRVLISRVLLLVTTFDDTAGTLAASLARHGTSLPTWVWVPHMAFMINSLSRCTLCRAPMTTLICNVAKDYPEAVVQQLMTLDTSSSDEKVDEFLQRICCAVRETRSELLHCMNSLTSHMDKKFAPTRFAWLTLIFLDNLMTRILDDFTCTLDDYVPPYYLQTMDSFIRDEVVPDTAESSTVKKRRGKSRGTSQFTERTSSASVLPSDDELKQRFAKDFGVFSPTRKSKKASLLKFVDQMKKWIVMLSRCSVISTGNYDRLSWHRFWQSSRYHHRILKELYTEDFSLSCFGNDIYNDSLLSAIEVPGQYALSSCRYREPRPDLHVKLVRIFPRVTRVFLSGEVLMYKIKVLGGDGQHIPFKISLKCPWTASSSGNESLFGQCVGYFEWCLQQHSLTRANDIGLVHSATVSLRRLQVPKIPSQTAAGATEGISSINDGFLPLESLSSSRSVLSTRSNLYSSVVEKGSGDCMYSMTRAVDEEVSPAGVCYMRTASPSSNPIIEYWNDAVKIRQEIEHELQIKSIKPNSTEEVIFQGLLQKAKESAFNRAQERNNTTALLGDALRRKCSTMYRNNNGEVFYSLRKTVATQLGVLGSIAFMLQSIAPSPREYIVSTATGRVLAYNMKPAPQKLNLPCSVQVDATATKCDDQATTGMEQCVVPDLVALRLSPMVVGALSVRVVKSTLKTAMGSTALAIAKQGDLTETIMMCYCLDGMNQSFNDVDIQSNQNDSWDLIAKTYADSFWERCRKLAPKNMPSQDDGSEENGMWEGCREYTCDDLVSDVISASLEKNSEFRTDDADLTPTRTSDISWAPWV